MKVLLLNPYSSNKHVPENNPLGLLYLAQAVRDICDPWVIDLDAMKYTWPEIERRLLSENPDVIGITCTTYSYDHMVRISRFARESLPETKVVIGGPHVSAKAQDCLDATRAHWAFTSESEHTFREFIQYLQGAATPEIAANFESNRIIAGRSLEPMEAFGFPARDLLEPGITTYLGNHPRHASPESVMLWGRGCPHKCTFCSDVVFMDRPMRMRDPDAIVEEIAYLKSLGVKEIFVYDDELAGMNPRQNKWMMEVCRKIIERGLNDIAYKCQGRCSRFATQEVLDTMAAAGFRTIMFGCESGSDRVLKAIRKGTTREAIESTMERCKKAGIERWMFLMVGFPEERPEDCRETVELVENVQPDFMQVTFATPYPSKLEEDCIEQGLVENWDMSTWNTHDPVIKNEHMSPAELKRWREKIIAAADKKQRSEMQVGLAVSEQYDINEAGMPCRPGQPAGPVGLSAPPPGPERATLGLHLRATWEAYQKAGLRGVYNKFALAYRRRFSSKPLESDPSEQQREVA